jgi:hypothetical protein
MTFISGAKVGPRHLATHRTTQQRRKREERNNDKEEDAPSGPPPAASSPNAQKPKRPRSLAARAYTPEFEAFFSDYPKTKTTNPKAEAFDVWERLSPADQLAATASLPAFAASCRQQFAGYQPPGAAVYLRKRRFDDHTSAPAVALDPEKLRTGQKAMARAHFRGEWRETWGAPPGQPGCTIPADVIAEVRNEAGSTLQ